jgi:hypothetical protein
MRRSRCKAAIVKGSIYVGGKKFQPLDGGWTNGNYSLGGDLWKPDRADYSANKLATRKADGTKS